MRPPGGPESQIRIRMRYIGSVKERAEYLRRVGAEGIVDDDILRENLAGWDGIADVDGTPVPFDDETVRADVLDLEYIYVPIRDAVIDEFVRGRAREKN